MLPLLKRAWALWKTMAEKIGRFNARLILTLVYLVMVLPVGLLYRILSDPLRIKTKPTNWIPKPALPGPPDYRRQF